MYIAPKSECLDQQKQHALIGNIHLSVNVHVHVRTYVPNNTKIRYDVLHQVQVDTNTMLASSLGSS